MESDLQSLFSVTFELSSIFDIMSMCDYEYDYYEYFIDVAATEMRLMATVSAM